MARPDLAPTTISDDRMAEDSSPEKHESKDPSIYDQERANNSESDHDHDHDHDHDDNKRGSVDENGIWYPDGGWAAWIVVFGAFCSMTGGLGIMNSTGVFAAYISHDLLPNESENNIGWIFGIYIFISYGCSVLIGPIFDARGPRELMVLGTICSLVGIFTLGECTEYYQFILAFSLLAGIGSSFLFTPAMGTISHWFFRKRALATGLGFIGSGIGGVIFPLMLQSLLPKVGWAWSMRIVGFLLIFLCVASVALCRRRLPPLKGAQTTWRDMLPDHRIFFDGTGAMAVTTIGVVLTEWAYYVPITYIPNYYIARQGLREEEAVSGSAAFAYQLLAINNGVSCISRYFAGDIADRIGRYNTTIISLFLCAVAVLGFWLPDATVDGTPSEALLIFFVVFYGLVNGANISLTPVCVGQLCRTQEYGRYYASCYTGVAFGCLASVPIAGNLVAATGIEGRKGYWAAITFTGVSYVLAFSCFVWVRIRVKGWDWRTKW